LGVGEGEASPRGKGGATSGWTKRGVDPGRLDFDQRAVGD
jgi:hypothetical protein